MFINYWHIANPILSGRRLKKSLQPLKMLTKTFQGNPTPTDPAASPYLLYCDKWLPSSLHHHCRNGACCFVGLSEDGLHARLHCCLSDNYHPYIGKDVCPKCIQIVQRFLQIRSNSRRILGLLYTEMSAEIYQDTFRLKTLTLFFSLLVSKIILVYWRSKLYRSSIYLMKISAFLSPACSLAFTNLARACARHT